MQPQLGSTSVGTARNSQSHGFHRDMVPNVMKDDTTAKS